MTEQSPVVPSEGAVPVEVPEEAVEVDALTREAYPMEFSRAVRFVADRVAARVRAEERQRVAAEVVELHRIMEAAIVRGGYRDNEEGDVEQRMARLAAGPAVPVATPRATSLDAAGIMRRFDQEISRSSDVIGRMDMGRTGGSVATPTEPTEPVDEVVCPNCEATIRRPADRSLTAATRLAVPLVRPPPRLHPQPPDLHHHWGARLLPLRQPRKDLMSTAGRVTDFLGAWQRGYGKPHNPDHKTWGADDCDACIAEAYDPWEAFVHAAQIRGML